MALVELSVLEQRRRPRSSYIRWEREEPMALWQMDIMGGVFLAGIKLQVGHVHRG